ncbi:hypothetical protein ACQY0O_001367 [Thecaphora frezii]
MVYDPFKPIPLSHERAALRASVIPFGLTIQTLTLDGGKTDLIVGPEHPKDHFDKGRNFFGPVIGRFANRLPAGTVKAPFEGGDALTLQLPEFSASGVSLHGGPAGQSLNPLDSIEQRGPFDRAIWQHLDVSDSQLFYDAGYTSSPNADAPASSAIFAIESPHGDNGYPGRLRVEVLVAILPSLTDDQHEQRQRKLGDSVGSFLIRYRAKILDDVAVTPLNLTQHWGFNLAASSDEPGAVAQEGRIDQHVVQFYPLDPSKGVKRLSLDDKMLADGTVVDLSQPDAEGQSHEWDRAGGKPIAESRLESGYDHFYVWGAAKSGLASSDAADLCDDKARRMRVSSDTTGISLTFHTNQAGTQIYCTEGQPPAPADADKAGGAMKKVHRKLQQGEELGNAQRSAIMIEFGAPHCGFLHPSLEQWGGGASLLRKGDIYDNWVTCQVWRK